MKKTILLSLVAAAVLFTACDEKTKSGISDVTSAVTSSVKETASKAVDATKEAASNVADKAVEKAGEVADVAKDTASKAVDATKDAASNVAEKAVDVKDAAVEKAAEATEVVANAGESADNAAGEAAYAKCVGCHGKDGKTQALGKSAVIAGQDVETLVTSMNEYKAGTRNVAGMGTLMKGQAASMSDEDIQAVSEYISGM
jgi:cytochrome c553